MKKIILLILISTLYSCGIFKNEQTEKGNIIVNQSNTNIENNITTQSSIDNSFFLSHSNNLESKNIVFEKKIEKDKILLFYKERIFLDNTSDLNVFKEFLSYGKKYNNIIIDSFYIALTDNLYNSDVLNDLVDTFEGTSFNLLVVYKNSVQHIPITKENIEIIRNHNPPAFFSLNSNFSQYPGKELFDKFTNQKYLNIEEFEEEFFDTWDSENILLFFGKYNIQKNGN